MASDIKILMVSTEYPPMQGGVGRYTHNLVKSLRLNRSDVVVVSSSDGSGDYKGISPHNKDNSKLLLNLVKEVKPDILHVQHEFGLYGLFLDSLRPSKTSTNIEEFSNNCTIPIVTTFHTSMYFKQYMKLVNIKEKGNDKDLLRLYSLDIHRIDNCDLNRKGKYFYLLLITILIHWDTVECCTESLHQMTLQST
ncbi:MAG TPA: glycosyltransferase [Nitrososphaeraceae archaeon]|nr:glycosyltransferase [Nitrososphaeraceae archaeon]